MPLFEASDLGCIRGDRAIFAGLGFSLEAGGLMLLIGPNGAGKSSLLRVLAGLLRPAVGRLAWNGQEVWDDLGSHHERLRYLGHGEAVKPALSAVEDLRFWAALRGLQAADIDRALARFDLADLADRPGRLLSAGQKRRLALARMTLGSAPLWLLDEPTVGLDHTSVERLARAVAEHRAAGGMAAIATHIGFPGETPHVLAVDEFPPALPDPEDELW
ncbi:heme ABC exporter ATP-binding protein CcmA [Algihabitans albus]|uniref:heme ABC exporter ATP-binding protein CcmA n=1 Tax=Algihabitans albus TaxID=2164067 RepID=UPI000E5CD5A4|nr:heme ABC exporter ATP-binding protein CcmA [Algihabitans albus]